ncbi:MAG: Uma2 family endonuclease [Gammaproteobacteria bacterium]|jgi:Uma2 family endonuclease|nr:Uma2 family endonuclease [Gammaproteobacteria bacterium]
MSPALPKAHCWSRFEYERLVDAGGFSADTRVELLDGEIIDMSPQKSAHATAVGLVEEALRHCIGEGYHIRSQKPLALDDRSEPEPDIAVVRGQLRDYAGRHPDTALLIVEVADTSLAYDQGSKALAYARNGVSDYWILNLRDRALEVYRGAESQGYGQRRLIDASGQVTPLVAPQCIIRVDDLLP